MLKYYFKESIKGVAYGATYSTFCLLGAFGFTDNPNFLPRWLDIPFTPFNKQPILNTINQLKHKPYRIGNSNSSYNDEFIYAIILQK